VQGIFFNATLKNYTEGAWGIISVEGMKRLTFQIERGRCGVKIMVREVLQKNREDLAISEAFSRCIRSLPLRSPAWR